MFKFKRALLCSLVFVFCASTAFSQDDESYEAFDDVDFVEEDSGDQLFEEGGEAGGEAVPAANQNAPLLEDGEIMDQIEELNKFSDDAGLKPFVYAERGRKNPFKRPSGVKLEVSEVEKDKEKSSGLEGYDLDAFEVTTVLWDIKYPKALVKSPNDEIYQVEEGTKIGRNEGYIAKIREGEVVVIESSMPNGESGRKFYKTQVLKLGR